MSLSEMAVAAPAAHIPSDPLMTDKQVEAQTGVATGTLRWWRHKNDGDGPKWFRLGPRAVRYRQSDVTAWIEEQYSKVNAG